MDELVSARNSRDANCDSDSNDSAGMSKPDKHSDFKLQQFSILLFIILTVVILVIVVDSSW